MDEKRKKSRAELVDQFKHSVLSELKRDPRFRLQIALPQNCTPGVEEALKLLPTYWLRRLEMTVVIRDVLHIQDERVLTYLAALIIDGVIGDGPLPATIDFLEGFNFDEAVDLLDDVADQAGPGA